MSVPQFKNLQQYEDYIKGQISRWAPDRRIALAAAAAERWFPAYEDFSTTEGWGDPAVLRRGLDSIWDWLARNHSSPVDWSHLKNKVQQVTPHMDDFDANDALCACVMVQYAIECCFRKDNLDSALMGMLSGLEAVVPDILEDEESPARIWKQAALRREIQNELLLIEKVGALADLAGAHQDLEPFFSDPQIIGEVGAWRDQEQIPAGPTNQQAFEQYQKIVQGDIRSAASGMDPGKYPDLAIMLILGAWMGRYSRRKQILSGEYGPLIDQVAVKFLVAKNRALDVAEPRQPNWDESGRQMIDMLYQNPHNGLDAATPESPHGYGPSVRRLWVQAKDIGFSDQQAWTSIEAWAHHQPAAWSTKPGKTSKVTAALKHSLEGSYQWSASGDPHLPWSAKVGEDLWQIRLNDFPDEVMYSLLINGDPVLDFHDWPPYWNRE